MYQDFYQIIILLIMINLGVCGYYYLVDQDNKKEKEKINQTKESYLQFIKEDFTSQVPQSEIDSQLKSQLEYQNPRTEIVHGFHDQFDKENQINKTLGWRHWWMNHQNKYQVPDDQNFSGTMVKRYLDSMESLENQVTSKDKQIR